MSYGPGPTTDEVLDAMWAMRDIMPLPSMGEVARATKRRPLSSLGILVPKKSGLLSPRKSRGRNVYDEAWR